MDDLTARDTSRDTMNFRRLDIIVFLPRSVNEKSCYIILNPHISTYIHIFMAFHNFLPSMNPQGPLVSKSPRRWELGIAPSQLL